MKLSRLLEENMANTIESYEAIAEVLNAPNSGLDTADLTNNTELLYTLILKSKELAILIASSLYNKPFNKINKTEAQPFRQVASVIVSQYWKKGNLEDLNLNEMAVLISNTAKRSLAEDAKFGAEATQTPRSQDHLEIATIVSSTLISSVYLYSFRKNPSDILSELSEAVVRASIKCAEEILPNQRGTTQQNALLLQLAKHNANLMDQIYNRSCATITHFLSGKPKSEIDAFYINYDAASSIINEFNNWSVLFSGHIKIIASKLEQ